MSMEGLSHGIPYCNVCLGSTDPDYQMYNVAISGVVLAIVGAIGLIGNCLVVAVYTCPDQRVFSTSLYLAALAVSDFLMICTAMFLFVLETWRHHGPHVLALLYGSGAPFIFPLGAIFQTTSVYFCVAAAVDCFIQVVLPKPFSEICCTPKKAKIVVFTMAVCCVFYNIPHCFELRAIECIEPRHDSALSLQICPTEIRLDPFYYTIYYTYMYTTFMAVGPLLLLIVLNICVVWTVFRKGASEDSDTVSLILVVCFFIFCNFTALLVNFLELTLYEQLKHVIVYLVDLSNLLVVINCTANFFLYMIFGNSFRRSLLKLLATQRQVNLLWTEAENNEEC
ncbi:G-PROTEIN-RECEP-F1-2 domain-containing protein [Aphelenchoides besseyi]|nr:G-PROTEIN-RECEP-F1-2 domain-containing protein [Aphelenchoides besseyi]